MQRAILITLILIFLPAAGRAAAIQSSLGFSVNLQDWSIINAQTIGASSLSVLTASQPVSRAFPEEKDAQAALARAQSGLAEYYFDISSGDGFAVLNAQLLPGQLGKSQHAIDQLCPRVPEILKKKLGGPIDMKGCTTEPIGRVARLSYAYVDRHTSIRQDELQIAPDVILMLGMREQNRARRGTDARNLLIGAAASYFSDYAQTMKDASSAVAQGDEQAALNSYQKYAMVGDPEAMARLGRLYLNGKSIERNEALGHSLLKRAAARGNALARKVLADDIDATATPDS